MTTCPSAATLSRILLDTKEGGATYSSVELHIEECAECKERLNRLDINDGQDLGGELPRAHNLPEIPGFEIGKELGRGGMGVVYLARQKNADRLVALKIVRSGPGAGSRERERWLREARAFSRVRHENVVTLFEFGEWDGWLYLVLDYIPGGTVDQTLKVPYAPRDAARLVEALARAVSATHAAGLLHLDLKPSNIFLDGPESMPRELAKPRLGDLGIARRWDESGVGLATASLGGPIGSPSHMAPEQITSERETLGPAADVYGLGAVLYHVLTGRPPFSAASTVETLDQVRNAEPVPPRRLNSKIPRDLETICLKCLQKAPARRYQTAEAVADDLCRWLAGKPITARPVSALGKSWRWMRRHPGLSGVTAALILTASLGFLATVLLWRRAESERIRAEEDYRIAADVLFESIDSNFRFLERQPINFFKVNASHDVEPALACLIRLKAHIIFLIKRRPDDIQLLKSLALANQRLSEVYARREDLDGMKDVVPESIVHLDRLLRIVPQDIAALKQLQHALIYLAELIGPGGDATERTALLARSIHVGETLVARWDESNPELQRDPLIILLRTRRNLAADMDRCGRVGNAKNLLEENVQLLERKPSLLSSAEAQLERSKTIYDLNAIVGKSSSVGDHRNRAMEQDPLARLLSPESESLSAEAWAAAVAEAMPSGTPARQDDAEKKAYITYRFIKMFSLQSAGRSDAGVLDPASKLAERLLALARRLVVVCPAEAYAHLALREAYIQQCKNILAIDDRKEVERLSKLALDAAGEAVKCDPNNNEASYCFAQCQDRLNKLVNPQ